MKTKTIFSVSGPIGSGKDTIGNYLIQNHGYHRMSFSYVLKKVVSVLFGWDLEMLEGLTPEMRAKRLEVDPWWQQALGNKFESVTPRDMLQYIGTEVFRDHFHRNIWATACMRQIHDSPHDKIVLTDTRFLNELMAVNELRDVYKVHCVNVFREIPDWWESFYQGVDQEFKSSWGESFTTMPNVQYSPTLMQSLADYGQLWRPAGVHKSEIEFLLWPAYDRTIDNSGKLESTYAQIEQCFK